MKSGTQIYTFTVMPVVALPTISMILNMPINRCVLKGVLVTQGGILLSHKKE